MKRLNQRVGDMHPNRALQVWLQDDGDVIVVITQNNVPIQGEDVMVNERAEAVVEFCTSGGRSPNTRKALRNLLKAIEKDNKENPINQLP